MTFFRELEWRNHLEEFGVDEQKILLALSNRNWLWRTMDSLERATGLESDVLAVKLKELMGKRMVRGSVSRGRRQPIFGLVERVGTGRNRKSY